MKIVFFTGAGISAESGISTFRDSNGLWERHDIKEICDIITWKKNRELVFKFYNERRNQLKEVSPNKIHNTIAKIEKMASKFGVEVVNITQNIDDLLERAGCRNIIHVHGKLNEMLCTACSNIWEIGYESIKPEKVRCPKCNSNKGVKPNVVFFGENAPNYLKMKKVFKEFSKKDILVVIGTSGVVIPISDISKSLPGFRILNNLEKHVTMNENNFDYVFYEKGSEAIEKIYEIIEEKLLESSS
jgi:NAD-dependent deacetylase